MHERRAGGMAYFSYSTSDRGVTSAPSFVVHLARPAAVPGETRRRIVRQNREPLFRRSPPSRPHHYTSHDQSNTDRVVADGVAAGELVQRPPGSVEVSCFRGGHPALGSAPWCRYLGH